MKQSGMITRQTLAFRLRDYLQHRITREALVDWAERAMMDEGFDDGDLDALRDITDSASRTCANSALRGKTAKAICRVSGNRGASTS